MSVRRSICYTAMWMALVIGLSSCAKSVRPPAPPPPAPPPAARAPPPPPTPAPPPAAKALTEEEVFARKSLDDLNKEMPLGDVFFDLDRSEIRDDGRSVLQRNATWLKRWSSTRITVEGHCDERGTAEYNLSLGERRANAVREYLVNLGVPTSRVLVISKGKESPFCTQRSEDCWQQNRRGHFVITAK